MVVSVKFEEVCLHVFIVFVYAILNIRIYKNTHGSCEKNEALQNITTWPPVWVKGNMLIKFVVKLIKNLIVVLDETASLKVLA